MSVFCAIEVKTVSAVVRIKLEFVDGPCFRPATGFFEPEAIDSATDVTPVDVVNPANGSANTVAAEYQTSTNRRKQ